LIKTAYTEYINDSLKQFEQITGKILPKQTPTCKFTSRFIFCPTLIEGELSGDNNGLTSEATVVKGYEKITEANFSSLVLPNNHSTLSHAHSFLPQLKSYAHPPVDENGVVNLTAEDMATLSEAGIDF
jgi:hypothetical protein